MVTARNGIYIDSLCVFSRCLIGSKTSVNVPEINSLFLLLKRMVIFTFLVIGSATGSMEEIFPTKTSPMITSASLLMRYTSSLICLLQFLNYQFERLRLFFVRDPPLFQRLLVFFFFFFSFVCFFIILLLFVF